MRSEQVTHPSVPIVVTSGVFFFLNQKFCKIFEFVIIIFGQHNEKICHGVKKTLAVTKQSNRYVC
jgi:hypothetical protein